ncbi:MAG: 50S ribosomal protein L24 [Candidatus Pacearchaeota archaeon]
MKSEFSKAWKSSKQPRKQIKYLVNAPIHIKRKMLGGNLSKDLRKKYEKRTIPLKKGDSVKVMRGKYKGQKGKIAGVDVANMRIEIEGIQVKKQDGSKVNAGLKHSNLQITELNLEGKKRNKVFRKDGKKEDKPETKPNVKQEEKKETKAKTEKKDEKTVKKESKKLNVKQETKDNAS